jgi:hypothetical protein
MKVVRAEILADAPLQLYWERQDTVERGMVISPARWWIDEDEAW